MELQVSWIHHDIFSGGGDGDWCQFGMLSEISNLNMKTHRILLPKKIVPHWGHFCSLFVSYSPSYFKVNPVGVTYDFFFIMKMLLNYCFLKLWKIQKN